jgi:hypothetical protein
MKQMAALEEPKYNSEADCEDDSSEDNSEDE